MSIPCKSILAFAALCAATPLWSQETARADFVGVDGAGHGSASLTGTPNGVLIRAELTGLPEGALGFHIHENGVCEAPFESAGGHYNPNEASHGFLAEGGPEAGDMPNIHVPASGEVTIEVFNTFVSLSPTASNSLLGEGGTALMVHGMADDYASQPSGEAGERIACAVIGR